MELIKSTLAVGAEKPFVILHVSDIHLSESDKNDSERRREFAAKRKKYFAFAPDAVAFIRDYVKKTGYPLINTGDLLDFITPENLRIAKAFTEETNMMMAAGNHEYWNCRNDRFHYDDAPAEYEGKNESLALVAREMGMDIRFSCKEVNGVKLVCMDDSDYDIDEDVFEKLRAVEAEGKPILLFLHIPLYSEHLGNSAKCSLNPPPQYFENCHPVDVWERTPSERTKEICDYIRRSPLIRCVISGHVHRSIEVIGMDAQDQLVTGMNTIREITVT
jgi:predicted MPP superfamily phosphohydrolase